MTEQKSTTPSDGTMVWPTGQPMPLHNFMGRPDRYCETRLDRDGSIKTCNLPDRAAVHNGGKPW